MSEQSKFFAGPRYKCPGPGRDARQITRGWTRRYCDRGAVADRRWYHCDGWKTYGNLYTSSSQTNRICATQDKWDSEPWRESQGTWCCHRFIFAQNHSKSCHHLLRLPTLFHQRFSWVFAKILKHKKKENTSFNKPLRFKKLPPIISVSQPF